MLIAGASAAWLTRNDTIVPRRQAAGRAARQASSARRLYHCHDGQIVTQVGMTRDGARRLRVSRTTALGRTRDWWLRTLLVLQRPRPVFAALRDDTREAAGDRAEPVLLIVLLAGIARARRRATAARLIDDGDYDGLLVAVWAFLAGGIYGRFGYFALGAAAPRAA